MKILLVRDFAMPDGQAAGVSEKITLTRIFHEFSHPAFCRKSGKKIRKTGWLKFGRSDKKLSKGGFFYANDRAGMHVVEFCPRL